MSNQRILRIFKKRYISIGATFAMLAIILGIMVEFQIVKRHISWEPSGIKSLSLAQHVLGISCRAPQKSSSLESDFKAAYPEASAGLALIFQYYCRNGYISEILLGRLNFWITLFSALILCILLRITCNYWFISLLGAVYLVWVNIYGPHSPWHIGSFHFRVFMFILVLFFSFYLFLTASFLLSILLSLILCVASLFFAEFVLIALAVLIGLVFILYNPWSNISSKANRLLYYQQGVENRLHSSSSSIMQKVTDFALGVMVRFRLVSLFNPLPEPFSLWIRRNRLRHWFIINALVPIFFYAGATVYFWSRYPSFASFAPSLFLNRLNGGSWLLLMPIVGKIMIHLGALIFLYPFVRPRMKVLLRIFFIFIVILFVPQLFGIKTSEVYSGASSVFDGVLTLCQIIIVGSCWHIFERSIFYKPEAVA